MGNVSKHPMARRVLITAANEAAVGGDREVLGTLVDYLLGEQIGDRHLNSAVSKLASDKNGHLRLDAMIRRAARLDELQIQQSGVASNRILNLQSRFAEACHELLTAATESIDVIAERASRLGESHDDVEEIGRILADGVLDILKADVVTVHLPGTENSRMRLVAECRATGGGVPRGGMPSDLRVDQGLIGDAIAGEQPLVLEAPAFSNGKAIDPLFQSATWAGGFVILPLRDSSQIVAGVLIAISLEPFRVDEISIDRISSLGEIGAIALSRETKRISNVRAVESLAALDDVIRHVDLPITGQLEELAGVARRAVDCDAVLVRVRDPGGRFIETRAAVLADHVRTGEVVGTRTWLSDASSEETDDDEHCFTSPEDLQRLSGSWQKVLEGFDARSAYCVPVWSRFDRHASVWAVRRTTRPLDPIDQTCLRIVAAQTSHVIDRHVAEIQTRRAGGAAQRAVKLLGEALVAGVREDRSLRFVPRLFMEMFECDGCRIWRHLNGSFSVVSAAGEVNETAISTAAIEADENPFELILDATRRPSIAGIGIRGYDNARYVIEFQVQRLRSLGQEEQRLVVDVARRVSEALTSAGQARIQSMQLERARALQNSILNAHNFMSERHVMQILLEEVPERLEADGAALLLLGDGGNISVAGSAGISSEILDEIVKNAQADGGNERSGLMAAPTVMDVDNGVILTVPLTGHEHTVGIHILRFSAHQDHLQEIKTIDNILSAFGRNMGQAMVNAREFERERLLRSQVERNLEAEREAGRQVRALHEVSRTFATSLSLEETMRAMVEALADRLDLDAVWVRVPGDRGNTMELAAFYAGHPELGDALKRIVEIPESRSDRLVASVIESGEPVIASAADEGAEIIDRLGPFLMNDSALAIVPVCVPGGTVHDVLGTVTMLSLEPDNIFTDERVEVARTVAAQAALALDNARLYEQQKGFAEIIQESLLPGRLPELEGIELGVLYRSATSTGADAPMIGGDFYDFLELDGGCLALAVGDVTGKGVEAAADTAMTKYIFRALAREHPQPADFLRMANEVVCEEISEGKFVTLFYAVIDPARSRITCGNAGHPASRVMTDDGVGGVSIISTDLEGLALGILPDQDFEQAVIDFPPGATLVVYTDGVVEARRQGKLYGQFRLEERVRREFGTSAPQVAYSLYEDCSEWSEGGLSDDVAIVVARNIMKDEI